MGVYMTEIAVREISMNTMNNRFFSIVMVCIVLIPLIFVLTGFNTKNTLDYKLTLNGENKSDLNSAKENQSKKYIVFFYSSSCSSCSKVEDFIESIVKRQEDIEVVRYNVSDINNAKLLQAYAKKYGIGSRNIGIPAVFISNTALIGEDKIIDELEERISLYDVNNPTPQVSVDILYEMGKDVPEDIKPENLITMFCAGLVNGINPCSLSMLLFLFSLIMTERKNILKVGISFCFGKFLMFFLLGTLLYKFIAILDINWVNTVVKVIVLIIVLAFALLNINDFIAAKGEKYNRLVLQLPTSLKKVYHGMMKKTIGYASGKYAVFIMALLGMLLALGEFLCTGQVYLFSVVFLIQRGGQGIEPLLGLVIYSFAFVLPLLLITLIIFKGTQVFNLSEKLLERLPIIKIISAAFFIAFGIYMVIFN
ncbi:MAG: hypothetical protein GX024_04975 [Clostridiales bacterium]|nr:hypothetical protein [Clostridiales bacterium]